MRFRLNNRQDAPKSPRYVSGGLAYFCFSFSGRVAAQMRERGAVPPDDMIRTKNGMTDFILSPDPEIFATRIPECGKHGRALSRATFRYLCI
jgi:hypothetical protein